MVKRLFLVALLGLLGCNERAQPSTKVEPEPDRRVEPPAKNDPVEASRDEPVPVSATETNASSETGDAHVSESETGELEPPPPKREVIRRRCKPGWSPCFGSRECCNDLLEVCGKDNHCHPLE